MAEYYPLIAKAISSLPNSTSESRLAIYDRARGALVRQLRSMQPPAPEIDITRETSSLNEAIARLESDLAPKMAETSLGQTSLETNRAEKRAIPEWTPKRLSAASGSQTPELAANPGDSVPDSDPEFRSSATSRVLPPKSHTQTEAAPDILRPSSDAARPYAPTAAPARKSNSRPWILGGAALLVVAGVASAAIWLKANSDDKVLKPKVEPIASSEAKSPGKAETRIGGAAAPPPVTTIVPAKPNSATAVTPALLPAKDPNLKDPTLKDSTPKGPAPKEPGFKDPATPSSTQLAPASATAPSPSIPIALRAALLVAAPEEAARFKTYVGTVVWSSLAKASATGSISIMHADVSVPDALLKFGFNLQKNDDSSFPASHMIDVKFSPESTSPITVIKEVRLPEMRQEDAAAGEVLRGGVVPITESAYLIGLSRIDRDLARNMELLTGRNWIDVSFTLADGREAKITFEKGVPGDQALKEALK